MTILIKGMKMAENCYSCKLGGDQGSGIRCRIAGQIYTNISNRPSSRPSWCLPTEVLTPHGRLIDADALLEHLGDTEYKGAVKRVLMQAPTIIEAEVEE